MNIGKYVLLFSEDLRLKNYSKNTIENYCSQIKLFLEKFNNIKTTMLYCHLSDSLISKIQSPITRIAI